MKIIKKGSLGHNGIKIYGLDFLIIKNKKFPGEHLLYFSHPIDEGNSGYIFILHAVISHVDYEKL